MAASAACRAIRSLCARKERVGRPVERRGDEESRNSSGQVSALRCGGRRHSRLLLLQPFKALSRKPKRPSRGASRARATGRAPVQTARPVYSSGSIPHGNRRLQNTRPTRLNLGSVGPPKMREALAPRALLQSASRRQAPIAKRQLFLAESRQHSPHSVRALPILHPFAVFL